MASSSDREVFGVTGPMFLNAIDWSNSKHRQSIAASLVQGVYVLERDRQQNRVGPYALAPPWWEFFNFKLFHVLFDDQDMSSFGAVFEFNFQLPYQSFSGQMPPKYVIAFRGMGNKPGSTRLQDLKFDVNNMINNLQDNRRFQIGSESTHVAVSKVGPPHVWLTGHGLGSSIALLIGRQMAKNTTHLETYLFNPPFTSAPIERIKNEKVKFGLRLANSVLTASLAVANGSTSSNQANDPFIVLCSWIPYLFINLSDSSCTEYIGYFEHREKMESLGIGKLGKIATKHSVASIASRAMGKHPEAIHLIPSAYLTVNSSPCNDPMEAYDIHQWWRPDLVFDYKLYTYK